MVKKINKNKLFLILFVGIFLTSFVYAQPPFDPVVLEQGIDINFPQFNILKQNADFKFHFHVINKSNGVILNSTDINCTFHLFNSTGNHIFENNGNVIMDDNNVDFAILILGGNFTRLGDYSYLFGCHSEIQNIGGQVSRGIVVTQSGAIMSEGNGIILLGIILILILTTIFFGISSIIIRNMAFKIFLGSLSILILISTIGFGVTIMQQLFPVFINIVSSYTLFFRLFIILLGAAGIGLVIFLVVFALKMFNKSRGTIE